MSKIGFYIEGEVQDCLIRRVGDITIGAYRLGIEIDRALAITRITVERVAEASSRSRA